MQSVHQGLQTTDPSTYNKDAELGLGYDVTFAKNRMS
jgi:hypothetical protein